MHGLVIEPIHCLRDNYAYLVVAGSDGWLVDPSEAGPPLAALRSRSLALRGILLTHHHMDHVGGVSEIVVNTASHPWVAGHASDRGRIPEQNVFVEAPTGKFVATDLTVGGCKVLAAHIPGHTRGAIAWYLPGSPGDVFTGDTLFGGGCGRLFEGTAAQMFDSLQTIVSVPEQTRLWFGHEYTATNLRFAQAVRPEDQAIAARASSLSACTTPSSVGLERATNLFVRAGSPAELGDLREQKDNFR